MKKIMMIAVMAIAVFTGCSQSEVVDISAGRAIGFETYVGKTSTRGVPVTGTSFGTGATMQVWGFYGTSQMGSTWDASAAALPNLAGAEITKGADAKWSYSPMAYWKDNNAHTFFACAPAVKAGVTFNEGKITYTVQDLVEDQVDFMVADAKKNEVWLESTGTTTPQVFAFRHALSQIKYEVKLTNDDATKATDVTVKHILIQNMSKDNDEIASTLATTGEIDVVGRTDTNADIAYVSAATGTANSYKVEPDVAVALEAASTTPEYVAVNHKTDDVLMLMPQTTTGKVKFTISLGYKDKDGADQTAEAYFITTAAQTWSPNKIYTYKFGIDMPQVLGLMPVEFGEPTIESWDTAVNEETPTQTKP